MRTEDQQWTLEGTLIQDLEKLISLEKSFQMTLPMMAQSTTNNNLQGEFERLHGQTREQIARLQCLITPGAAPKQTPMDDQEWYGTADPHLMNGLLVAEARKKQYAKIALYSTACLWATQLGLSDVEESLAQNLKEEEDNCERLLQLAREVMRPSA